MRVEILVEVQCDFCRKLEWAKYPLGTTPEFALQESLGLLRKLGWICQVRKDSFSCPRCLEESCTQFTLSVTTAQEPLSSASGRPCDAISLTKDSLPPPVSTDGS